MWRTHFLGEELREKPLCIFSVSNILLQGEIMKLYSSQKYWKTIFGKVRLFLIVSFLFSAHQLSAKTDPLRAKAEWTILVYAQAKNNLSNLLYYRKRWAYFAYTKIRKNEYSIILGVSGRKTR